MVSADSVTSGGKDELRHIPAEQHSAAGSRKQILGGKRPLLAAIYL